MTAEELIAIRKSWDWTQTTMANQLGISLRAYQDIENGRAAMKQVYSLAVERISLSNAALKGDNALLLETVRSDISLLLKL